MLLKLPGEVYATRQGRWDKLKWVTLVLELVREKFCPSIERMHITVEKSDRAVTISLITLYPNSHIQKELEGCILFFGCRWQTLH